jgi:hypothetical protein
MTSPGGCPHQDNAGHRARLAAPRRWGYQGRSPWLVGTIIFCSRSCTRIAIEYDARCRTRQTLTGSRAEIKAMGPRCAQTLAALPHGTAPNPKANRSHGSLVRRSD